VDNSSRRACGRVQFCVCIRAQLWWYVCCWSEVASSGFLSGFLHKQRPWVGGLPPPLLLLLGTLSQRSFTSTSSRHADVDSFTHSVCVCAHTHTSLLVLARASAHIHNRTHTYRPVVVQGYDADGPRFMMKVLLQGISVNLFRGKEVQEAYKKAIQQLPRVSLASRHTTKTKNKTHTNNCLAQPSPQNTKHKKNRNNYHA